VQIMEKYDGTITLTVNKREFEVLAWAVHHNADDGIGEIWGGMWEAIAASDILEKREPEK